MSVDFTIQVDIAFDTDIDYHRDFATWTNVTDYTRGTISIKRGRQRETDRVEAGRCTFVLDNRDRRFDPLNADGPYYGNILPLKKVRIRATHAGSAMSNEYLFLGYIESWQMGWQGPDATVEVTCVDGFKILSGVELPSSVYEHILANMTVPTSPDLWFRLGDKTQFQDTRFNISQFAGIGGNSELAEYRKRVTGTYTDNVTLEVGSLTYRDSDGAVGFNGRTDDANSDGSRAAITTGDEWGINSLPYTLEFLVAVPPQFDAEIQEDEIPDVDQYVWLFCQARRNTRLQVMISSPGQYATGGSLVGDSSFENVASDGSPFTTFGSWTKSNEQANTGTYSMKVTTASGVGATIQSPFVPVTQGETYDISITVRTSVGATGGAASLSLVRWGPNIGFRSDRIAGPTHATDIVNTWTTLTAEWDMDVGATHAAIFLSVGNWNVFGLTSTPGAATWYVDDAVIAYDTAAAEFGGTLVVSERFEGTGGNPAVATRSTQFIDDGFPHHVVITRASGENHKIYIDGVLTGSENLFDDDLTTDLWSGEIFLGGPPPGAGGQYLRGALDEVAIWDGVALSAAAIYEHFQAASLPWDEDLPGERIERILDDILNWPDGWNDNSGEDTGNTVLGPATFQKAIVLEYIQRIITSEGATSIFFMNRKGEATFRDRHHQLRAGNNTPHATFGDAYFVTQVNGKAPYITLNLVYDDSRIFNNVEVSREFGTEKKAEDTTSQNDFGKRTLVISGLLHRYEEDAGQLGDFLLDQYKQPFVRVDSVAFRPQSLPTVLYPQAIQRELGDRIQIQRKPPGTGSGDPIDFECLIEGIEHTITPTGWETTWWLSNAEPGTGFLILNDATYGKLSSGNKLAY